MFLPAGNPAGLTLHVTKLGSGIPFSRREEVGDKRALPPHGSGRADILIYTGRTPDDTIEALEEAVKEQAPTLVIIDPLSRCVRVSDFNSYAEVTRALEPLIVLARAGGSHVLALHHYGKGDRGGGDALDLIMPLLIIFQRGGGDDAYSSG